MRYGNFILEGMDTWISIMYEYLQEQHKLIVCFGQTTWEEKGIADPVSRTFSIKVEQKPNAQRCLFLKF